MQFCYCPGVGHLHSFLKPHHDEFFCIQKKTQCLSLLLVTFTQRDEQADRKYQFYKSFVRATK